MHATIVSTYPPRACGLATFARDLRRALAHADTESDVVSIVHEPAGDARRAEVALEVRQPEREDYAAAARFLDGADTDVVSVQHEFGIFGGSEGRHVLDLIAGTRRPVVTTLHTVLPDPPDHYRSALLDVARASDRLVVMTDTARVLLDEVYGVAPECVAVIPHGAPALDPAPDAETTRRLGLEGRTVLLTFGLLGPSKGIEFALAALGAAVEAQPDLLYVVLGATHPEIVRREGEAYRETLQAEVAARGLEDHVRFVDEYVEDGALWDWLRSADVYVSPYPGMDQICSGTLANALAAGLPVVSTPYLHAREVLADGAGALVPYGDVEAFGHALARFASDPDARATAGARARAFGATTTWPLTGEAYAALFAEVARERRAVDGPRTVHPGALPASIGYLARITDDVGPIQHATYGFPDRAHGYSADDAARALVVAYAAAQRPDVSSPERRALLALARTCLSFVHHAQTPRGSFHNFLTYGRQFVDDGTGEDTTGRALWGLGATIAWAPDEPARRLAREVLDRAAGLPLGHPRAQAYAALGLDLALERAPDDGALRDRLRALADGLVTHFEQSVGPRWRWFCDRMTYANAIVPEALLRAGDRLDDDGYCDVGQEALEFVLSHTVRDGQFDAIGNQGWLTRDGDRAEFDQQPIDAGYAAWFWSRAHRRTGSVRLREAARLAVEWFFGRNRLGLPLFDETTGACFDGLTPSGVNQNQGAESVVASLLALLAADDLGMVSDTPEPTRPEQATA